MIKETILLVAELMALGIATFWPTILTAAGYFLYPEYFTIVNLPFFLAAQILWSLIFITILLRVFEREK